MSLVLPLITALLISLGIQTIFFCIAAYNKTDKVTDLSYGLTFILLTLYFFSQSAGQPFQIIVTFLVCIWGIRIAGYLFLRILHTKKDSRFDTIRNNFWKFGSFWLLQAVSIWIILLPTLILLLETKDISFHPVMFMGVAIWLIGIVVEHIADMQKFAFKKNPKNKDTWIASGLWKYSRHPNYFGEMLCWWGIFLIAFPLLSGFTWLAIIGPLFITYLLVSVSGIPPLEKKYNEKYANNSQYQAYKAKTSLLIPWPPKR